MKLQIEQFLPIVKKWAETGEIPSPAHGDHWYIGFPRILEFEGQEIVRLLERSDVVFYMGEFMRLKPRS